jgi:hypothetical protein
MATILPTQQPAFWLVKETGDTGQTFIGELTGVSNSLTAVFAEGEQPFLDAVVTSGATFSPLPERGTELTQGQIYSYGSDLLMVRQSHARTEHDPATVPALFLIWRENADEVLEWIVGEKVDVGTRRKFDGKVYEAVQAHATQADWTPPATPALWREVIITPPTAEWQAGVAYKVGDEVTYKDKLYRCRQAHTSIVTWEPPNVLALWLPL